jgi:8-oxo-dGTP pyrophosphatase MutT (NUDIX family)
MTRTSDPTGYSLEDWLSAAQQPVLPSDLPDWLEPLVTAARSGAETGIIGDAARDVPEVGPGGEKPRYSAVLVLVGDRSQTDTDGPDPSVLLTHRNPRMRTHSGQIAFPGGRRESTDTSPVDTAIREAVEETDCDPDSIVPVALLQPLYIDRTNHAVIPVIAWWRTPGRVRPATEESDWVRPVRVAELADPGVRSRIGFLDWHGPAFNIDGYLLWGFTGGVVDAVLRLAEWDEPWEKLRQDGEPAEVVDLFAALELSRNGENLIPAVLGDRLGGELESELEKEDDR